ncbi:MAG TPA: DUF2062 domain-containing protein [Thermoanaerobaculia bacterium]|nr:DUF2062 domain-containing protein [Thermoanaerobaculia bacterium]
MSGDLRGRWSRPLLQLLYDLRTAGDSPGRQAAAVGVGVFIGLTPFFGFHLALCVLAARLLRLNQIKTYLAAHVSLPFLWPLVVLGELQLGRRLHGEPFLAIRLAEIRRLDPWRFGGDLLLGSTALGLVLAVAFAALTYRLVLSRRRHGDVEDLIDQTSRRYIEAGVSAWEFVRAKLRHDPLYFGLLRRGGLPDGGLLLDLGCGRGILLALLAAAREQAARSDYPAGWPPPPAHLAFHGIEGRAGAAAAARLALGAEATIEVADLRRASLPPARAIVLLDVLHYLPAAEQERLLDRAAAALEGGGLLVLREADAAAGDAFARTRAAERLSALARGHWRQRFHYRTAGEWSRLLGDHGLAVARAPMSAGTPFANVLIEGRKSS